MTEQWLRWSEALQRIDAAGYAQSELVNWIDHDALHVRAQFLYIGHTEFLREQPVPKWLWHGARETAREGELSRIIHWWDLGPEDVEFRSRYLPEEYVLIDGSDTYGEEAYVHVRAVGIEFWRADFDELIPPQVTPQPDPAKNRGGAPPKIEAWHRVYREAFRMALDGSVRDYPNQAKFRDALAKLVPDQLTEESMRKPVRALWALVNPDE